VTPGTQHQRIATSPDIPAVLCDLLPIVNAGLAALDLLAPAVFVVDACCTLVFANRTGERALHVAATVQSRESHLALIRAVDTTTLRQAVAGACTPPYQAAAFTAFGHGESASALVRVVPVKTDHLAPLLSEGPMTFVFVSDEAPEIDTGTLQQWFSLTCAEAQLLKLLAQGQLLQQCAAVRGVSTATARSQLARILAKTGTTTQTQLLAKVLRLGWLSQ